ncbi:hypothetical protein KEJ27_08195 [Candidatus Bathyarchaeota archaeon]|nr:hypothetical protein [Candidatus Bathyarchaeota archaeon]
MKTLDLDGLKVYVYVEKFDNALFILISKQGFKMGTLIFSIKGLEEPSRSTTLLGWRGEVQARIFAEKASSETGLMTLLSINLEEEHIQKHFRSILETLNQCIKEVSV